MYYFVFMPKINKLIMIVAPTIFAKTSSYMLGKALNMSVQSPF